jgi:putative membrane protein
MPQTEARRPHRGTLLTAADEDRVSAAIERVERTTSGEVVAVIAAESDTYAWAPVLAAALMALAIAAPLIVFTWLDVRWIYAWQVIVFLAATALLSLRPVRYALVPRAVKRARAHARAVEQFLAQNLHTTAGRTGVLIFVSFAERYAEILADAGIHAKVPATEWQAIVDRLTAHLAEGRPADGFIAAIEASGALLAAHFPPGTHDPNALPNHLIVLA